VTRAISRSWPMTIVLPDLGPTFTVQPLTAGNRQTERATAGRFAVKPGVYVLSSAGPVKKSELPVRLGELEFAEYHSPPPDSLPPSIQPLIAPSYLTGRDAELRARIVDATPPDSATLFIRPAVGGFYRAFKMRAAGGYEYAATVAAAALEEGPHEFVIVLFRGRSTTTFPAGVHRKPWDWDYDGRASWPLEVVSPRTPLRLFSPVSDAVRLAFTRIGDAGRSGLFRVRLSGVTGLPVFHFERPVDARGWSPDDYTASLVIKDRIVARRVNITDASALQVRLRALGPRQRLHITLMEYDGTSWSAAVTADSSWSEQAVPLDSFVLDRGVLLPQGFPGEWNYWVGPAAGRGTGGDRLRLDHVERLQLSLRREEGVTVSPASYGVEVESIVLRWNSVTTGPGGRRM